MKLKKLIGLVSASAITAGSLSQNGTPLEAQFKVLKPNAKIDMILEEVANGDFDGIDITDQVITNSVTQAVIECAHGTLEWVTVSGPTHAENGLRQQICLARFLQPRKSRPPAILLASGLSIRRPRRPPKAASTSSALCAALWRRRSSRFLTRIRPSRQIRPNR